MTKSRKKMTVLNSVSAFGCQALIFILNFVVRKYFVVYLGAANLGFDSLFYNLLGILSIVDLGFTSVMYFSLYKPVADGNIEKINSYINYFKKIFLILGIALITISITLSPFVHYVIKDLAIDVAYIQKIFILYSIWSFSSYFFVYPRAILTVSQDTYIIWFSDLFFKGILRIFQVYFLVKTSSYFTYLYLEILFLWAENIFLMVLSRKKYKEYFVGKNKLNIQEKKDIIVNVKYLGISKIATVGINNTDSLIISFILGITPLALYSNYRLICSASFGLISALINGIVPSLGNYLSNKNTREFKNIFDLYFLVCVFVGTLFFVVVLVIIQPFISFFFGSEYLLGFLTVFVIVFNFFESLLVIPIINVGEVLGIFKQKIPYDFVQFFLNVFLSVVLAFQFGVFGVFFATTISSLVSHYLFSKYIINHINLDFKLYLKKYLFVLFLGMFELALSFGVLSSVYSIADSSLFMLVVYVVVTSVLVCLINYLVFRKTDAFKQGLEYIKLIIGRTKSV